MLSRRLFLALTGGTFAAPALPWGDTTVPEVPTVLDHILLGCSDLDAGIAFVQRATGIPAMPGGAHPGRGTRNALLSLGEPSPEEPSPHRYLEIIAPDPEQPDVPDRLGLKKLTEPRLVGWAAHPGNLDEFATRLRAATIAFDGPTPGSRKRADGRLLQWRTLNLHDDFHGLLPFFIEWSADTIHPSADAPRGCQLERFDLLSPHPDILTKTADQLVLGVAIAQAPRPQLSALIRSAGKRLQLVMEPGPA